MFASLLERYLSPFLFEKFSACINFFTGNVYLTEQIMLLIKQYFPVVYCTLFHTVLTGNDVWVETIT